MRLQPGQRLDPIALRTLQDQPLQIPDAAGRLTHLQFRRFAGCPICNLHLRSFAARLAELESAGLVEVAVFHSEAETMRPYQGDLPFAVIADPKRALYQRFGVERSLWSWLDPRAWGAATRGLFLTDAPNPMVGEGGHDGLPADFLIGADGTLLACKYGTHADDQWSLDELLGQVHATRS